jgi:hypothetical protein
MVFMNSIALSPVVCYPLARKNLKNYTRVPNSLLGSAEIQKAVPEPRHNIIIQYILKGMMSNKPWAKLDMAGLVRASNGRSTRTIERWILECRALNYIVTYTSPSTYERRALIIHPELAENVLQYFSGETPITLKSIEDSFTFCCFCRDYFIPYKSPDVQRALRRAGKTIPDHLFDSTPDPDPEPPEKTVAGDKIGASWRQNCREIKGSSPYIREKEICKGATEEATENLEDGVEQYPSKPQTPSGSTIPVACLEDGTILDSSQSTQDSGSGITLLPLPPLPICNANTDIYVNTGIKQTKEDSMQNPEMNSAKKKIINRWNGMRRAAKLSNALTNTGDGMAVSKFICDFSPERAVDMVDRFLDFCENRSRMDSHGFGLLWTMARNGDLDDDFELGLAHSEPATSGFQRPASTETPFKPMQRSSASGNAKATPRIAAFTPSAELLTAIQEWNGQIPSKKVFGATQELADQYEALAGTINIQEDWGILLQKCSAIAGHEKAVWLNFSFAMKKCVDILNGKYDWMATQAEEVAASTPESAYGDPTQYGRSQPIREPFYDSVHCDQVEILTEANRQKVSCYWLAVNLDQQLRLSGKQLEYKKLNAIVNRVLMESATHDDIMTLYQCATTPEEMRQQNHDFIFKGIEFAKRDEPRLKRVMEWPL